MLAAGHLKWETADSLEVRLVAAAVRLDQVACLIVAAETKRAAEEEGGSTLVAAEGNRAAEEDGA